MILQDRAVGLCSRRILSLRLSIAITNGISVSSSYRTGLLFFVLWNAQNSLAGSVYGDEKLCASTRPMFAGVKVLLLTPTAQCTESSKSLCSTALSLSIVLKETHSCMTLPIIRSVTNTLFAFPQQQDDQLYSKNCPKHTK